MGKQKDPIWDEWTRPTNRNGKSYAACRWCGYELQVNTCRLKLHTVVHCKSAPPHIKSKYPLAASMSGGKLLSSTHDDCAGTRSAQNTVVSVVNNVNESESDKEVCNDDQMPDDVAVEPPVKFPRSEIATTTSTEYANHSANSHVQQKLSCYCDSISTSDQRELDLLWAESVYTNNWSFNSMNCPVLQKFFKKIRPSYRPPSAYKLAHNLLDTISDQVDKENSRIIDKGINLTVLVDGCTDVNNASLVNVAVFAGSPIFLKSVAPGANRHDAELIAKTILDVIEKTPADFNTVTNKSKGRDGDQTVHYVDERKFRSVVTDQPAVMTAAWRMIESAKPWVHCYGCGAHVINLLAGDIGKISEISSELDNNRKIAVIFRSHSMCKEVLKETTLNKFSKSLNVVLSCKTRWSTEYFMVARNLRLKDALICACVDPRLTKEMRNSDVKTLILSDSDAPGDFWKATERIFYVLKPLKTAIQFCEGDNVPLSVMPRMWQFIANQLDISVLRMLGFNDETANAVTAAVKARRAMTSTPITFAAYVIDPRFHGEGLAENEWSDACDVINFCPSLLTSHGPKH